MKRLHYAMAGIVLVLALSYALFNISDLTATITGKAIVSTRLVIIQSVSVDCNMSLEQGWNLVSFPCISDPIAAENFLENLSDFEDLRSYVATDSDDPWKIHNPDLPNWVVQDLSSVNRKSGYWLYLSNDSLFVLSNELATPSIIDLEEGWNLIGYPNTTITYINDTFGPLIPDFDFVHMYNATDSLDPWKEWTWNTSLSSDQDFNYTRPNYGYWIFMLNESSLTIR